MNLRSAPGRPGLQGAKPAMERVTPPPADVFERLCQELSTLTPRQRLSQLRELERLGEYPGALLTELGDYFRIAHERRDVVGLVGSEISGFRILDVLGAGGSGVVYLAERNGEQVALKLIHPDANPATRQLFDSELASLEAIQSPGVARLRAHGEHATRGEVGLPFLVTELVHGLPLDRYVSRRGASVAECSQLVASVSDTLATIYRAHALVHLDIKPDNILVSHADRQPRLVDFGLSRRIRGCSPAPSEEAALTPEFTSPEQLVPGRFGLPGSHSDQYSLALVLYFLLTGERTSSAQRGAGSKPALASVRNRDCSPALARVVDRALSPEVSERFPDLESFSQALRSEAGALARFRRLRRGKRAVLWLAVGALGFWGVELASRSYRSRLANADGRAAQRANQPVLAAEKFEAALLLDPSNEIASYNAGVSAEDVFEYDRARRAYYSALERAHDELPALNNLARVLVLQGKPAQAVSVLEKGLERLGPVTPDSDVETHRRAYRLHKNLGWAELELARRFPSTRALALSRAEHELRLALASNGLLLEHDAINGSTAGRPAGEALEHDGAAYCLLAQVLGELGTSSRPERTRWWRSCLETPSPGEPAHEVWKREARAFLEQR